MGATGDRKGEIYDKSALGKARPLRVLIDAEQPRTHMPKPTRPQFLGIKIDEAPMKHRTL